MFCFHREFSELSGAIPFDVSANKLSLLQRRKSSLSRYKCAVRSTVTMDREHVKVDPFANNLYR